jgi:Na+/alanine symporter
VYLLHSTVPPDTVIDVSDIMLLSMAFPNIIGMILLRKVLSPK